MQVTIDHSAGFCKGVEHSVRIAEDELERGGTLFCLGEIIHNRQEVSRLSEKGLQIIDHDAFSRLKDVRVLIRAHGEPPETYRIARENNITLIDTTCRIVRTLQQRIREDDAEAEIRARPAQRTAHSRERRAQWLHPGRHDRKNRADGADHASGRPRTRCLPQHHRPSAEVNGFQLLAVSEWLLAGPATAKLRATGGEP